MIEIMVFAANGSGKGGWVRLDPAPPPSMIANERERLERLGMASIFWGPEIEQFINDAAEGAEQ